ncbi:MAG: aminopeptidase P family protein [Spirochaetia bacterium]
MSTIPERIAEIRKIMRVNGIDCCIIPTSDWHQTEIPAEYFDFREFLSGFTGSAGSLIILADRCFLWTDGRYELQADKELDGTEIETMIYESGDSEIIAWLSTHLRQGQVVGIDSRVFSLQWYLDAKRLLGAAGINLSDIQTLLDSVFVPRPEFPSGPIYPLAKEYTGYSTAEKLIIIREMMRERHIENYLVATLDDIAWLCNLRGSDICHTPIFYAYLLLEPGNNTLFTQISFLTPEAIQSLKKNGIQTLEYLEAESHFSYITLGNIHLSYTSTNAHIAHILERNNHLICVDELIQQVKAVKHSAEIASMREAHHQDGAAMVRALHQLEEKWKTGINEYEVSELLLKERQKESLFRDLSFSTIVGYGSNGAIVHYSIKESSAKSLQNGLTVIDSGGQFMGATTDITRTFCSGDLTEEEMTDYTLTLKTHIALASCVFVAGASSAQLDGIARHTMWTHGIDYSHGTGHGVGAMLCVHEPPMSLRGTNLTKLMPGMFVTIEPGIYKEGKHGVRIENLYLVVEKVKNDKQFLAFEAVSLCPIQTIALRKELLTQEEIAWLNTYHQKVLKSLTPLLSGDDLAFLEQSTRPI